MINIYVYCTYIMHIVLAFLHPEYTLIHPDCNVYFLTNTHRMSLMEMENTYSRSPKL